MIRSLTGERVTANDPQPMHLSTDSYLFRMYSYDVHALQNGEGNEIISKMNTKTNPAAFWRIIEKTEGRVIVLKGRNGEFIKNPDIIPEVLESIPHPLST